MEVYTVSGSYTVRRLFSDDLEKISRLNLDGADLSEIAHCFPEKRLQVVGVFMSNKLVGLVAGYCDYGRWHIRCSYAADQFSVIQWAAGKLTHIN